MLTIAVYSMRARPHPTVSTPVTWDELQDIADTGNAGALRFTPSDVLARVDELGDLYADSIAGDQDLPDLS